MHHKEMLKNGFARTDAPVKEVTVQSGSEKFAEVRGKSRCDCQISVGIYMGTVNGMPTHLLYYQSPRIPGGRPEALIESTLNWAPPAAAKLPLFLSAVRSRSST